MKSVPSTDHYLIKNLPHLYKSGNEVKSKHHVTTLDEQDNAEVKLSLCMSWRHMGEYRYSATYS
jgi:hypothetical protein